MGVSVDGLFSVDNWQTTIVQPGFYFQDYDLENYLCTPDSPQAWLYPKGNPTWKIRFSPTTVGTWQYMIRVTDSSGTITYTPPNNSFTCIASSLHGFVGVSPTDARYFQTSDSGGQYLNLQGLRGT